MLSKILRIDLISLTKWLLPVLWSIIFTILLYEIGLALGWTGSVHCFCLGPACDRLLYRLADSFLARELGIFNFYPVVFTFA